MILNLKFISVTTSVDVFKLKRLSFYSLLPCRVYAVTSVYSIGFIRIRYILVDNLLLVFLHHLTDTTPENAKIHTGFLGDI